MATQSLALTATPQRVTAAAGTSFIAQNAFADAWVEGQDDAYAYVAVTATNAAPTGAALANAFVLKDAAIVEFKVGAGEFVWAWADVVNLPDAKDAGRLVYQPS